MVVEWSNFSPPGSKVEVNMSYCHPFLLAHLAKGNMTFLPSLFKFKSSTMKPLNQIKPNLAEIVLWWCPFRIMADSPIRHIQDGHCYCMKAN
jgi:hypothetical protein